jgi:hypothetical protein
LNEKLWGILNKQILRGKNKGKIYWDAVLEAVVKKAMQGVPWAVTFVYERFAGKASQSIEMTGKEGGPLEIAFVSNFDGV